MCRVSLYTKVVFVELGGLWLLLVGNYTEVVGMQGIKKKGWNKGGGIWGGRVCTYILREDVL